MNYPSLLIIVAGESKFCKELAENINLDHAWPEPSVENIQNIESTDSLKAIINTDYDLILLDWVTLGKEGYLDPILDLLKVNLQISWVPVFKELKNYQLDNAIYSIGYLLSDQGIETAKARFSQIYSFLLKPSTDLFSPSTLIELNAMLCDFRICHVFFPYFNKEAIEVFTIAAIEKISKIPLEEKANAVKCALVSAFEDYMYSGEYKPVDILNLPKRWISSIDKREALSDSIIKLHEIEKLLSSNMNNSEKLVFELKFLLGENWKKGILDLFDTHNQSSIKKIIIDDFYAIKRKMLLTIFLFSHQEQTDKCVRLNRHISPLKRKRPIEVMLIHDLPESNQIRRKIEHIIDISGISIALICPHFLDADSRELIHLERILLRHPKDVVFIPVIASPCNWTIEPLLSNYHDTKFVILETDQHYLEIVEALDKHVDDLLCRA
jgi:hypothetical protein